MNLIKISEIMGAATGIIAALMIALNLDLQVLAFSLFIFSDIAWIYVAVEKKMPELFWMSMVYSVIGGIGIYNWI